MTKILKIISLNWFVIDGIYKWREKNVSINLIVNSNILVNWLLWHWSNDDQVKRTSVNYSLFCCFCTKSVEIGKMSTHYKIHQWLMWSKSFQSHSLFLWCICSILIIHIESRKFFLPSKKVRYYCYLCWTMNVSILYRVKLIMVIGGCCKIWFMHLTHRKKSSIALFIVFIG